MRRRELPWDYQDASAAWMGEYFRSLPENALSALMETPPGGEVRTTTEDVAALREAIGGAIDSLLTDRERWIVEALWYRRISLRTLAAELSLSKTHLIRLRDGIMLRLQNELVNYPEVRRHLARYDV